jgi:hypothetical protein
MEFGVQVVPYSNDEDAGNRGARLPAREVNFYVQVFPPEKEVPGPVRSGMEKRTI